MKKNRGKNLPFEEEVLSRSENDERNGGRILEKAEGRSVPKFISPERAQPRHVTVN